MFACVYVHAEVYFNAVFKRYRRPVPNYAAIRPLVAGVNSKLSHRTNQDLCTKYALRS